MALSIKPWIKWSLLLPLFFTAAAFSGEDKNRQTHDKNRHTYVFECEDGESFVADIQGTRAWVFLTQGTVELKQQPDGTFAGDPYRLQLQGSAAQWVNQHQQSISCRNNRQQAIWEAAKLAGVDYRAVGNEPGWVVEIAADQVRYQGDYGQTLWVFDTPPPQIEQTLRQTVYLLANEQQQVTFTIQAKPCMDSMSGVRYETTAIVQLPGKTLKGCGRALH
ncbi:COG3650 family protein [Oceanicoccus sagamiensis]|uniref:C-type lysozyme inhibitor domain-containing protein n=1 Tax=Oceanicoccus sagamiensis TaxID=716816 RepID=A0A1X9NEG2_9GAMM|nr:hypothetical protein [Oceanicoccus sagamiensis]ARN74822.1 hypothetical protein BST96_12260 [Oceanicoccus sagamiensis]